MVLRMIFDNYARNSDYNVYVWWWEMRTEDRKNMLFVIYVNISINIRGNYMRLVEHQRIIVFSERTRKIINEKNEWTASSVGNR